MITISEVIKLSSEKQNLLCDFEATIAGATGWRYPEIESRRGEPRQFDIPMLKSF